jgi:DNA-binding ferritin-like protein
MSASSSANPDKTGPRSTREALMAELFGDVDKLLKRCEAIPDQVAQAADRITASTQALDGAGEQYRARINEIAERMRVETSTMLVKVTNQAATTLVQKQSAFLQEAATIAIRNAIAKELGATLRKYSVLLVCTIIASSLLSAVIVVGVISRLL